MSKARERQKRRRQQREMVSKRSISGSQAKPEGQFQMPEVQIPGGRWLLIIPAAGLILIAVILALRFINPPDTITPPNAIWLNIDWVYGDHATEDIVTLMETLRENEIGRIYLYVSSLRADDTWSGRLDGNNRFTEVESDIETLISQIRSVYPSVQIYAWVEVNTSTPEYRLDQTQVQNAIANFSTRMINQLDFDGVLLDVKPIFEENEDYIEVLRSVRRQIGFDAELIVAVPPDLTPTGTELNLPDVIVPGTEWSSEYKQRVALIANQIVITAYNSYQENPVDYIEWVGYQVDSYVEVLSQIDSDTTIIVSVPNYDTASQAHDPEIESLEGGLDGVMRVVETLDEASAPLFSGVAIYTEELLTNQEWRIYRQRMP